MKTRLPGSVKSFNFRPELMLVAVLLLLLIWGMHALGCTDSGTEFNQFLLRQIQWTILGTAILAVAAAIPFVWWEKTAFGWCLAALLLVLAVTFCGRTVNGMRGWFGGSDWMFQPSEFAKPLFLLALVKLSVYGDDRHRVQAGRLLLFLPFALLLAKQPDFGMLLVYFAALLITQWLCSRKPVWLLVSLGGGIVAGSYALLRFPYVVNRFQAFWNPEADFFRHGWHTMQFRIALAHGGWTGAADGKALWSSLQLPLSHSDSAFAAICEAAGFLGGAVVLLALAAMLWAGWLAFKRGRDRACDRFILAGTALCVFQGLLHISVNLTVFPITGLTLPFISYGGSSLTAYMLMFGMIFSAMREQYHEENMVRSSPAPGLTT